MSNERRLVVVSNRIPAASDVTTRDGGRAEPVSGLVSAVRPVMEKRGGLWFGWSGRGTQRRPSTSPSVATSGGVQLATLDLSEDEVSQYYTGFANRTLWPLLHSFPERVVIRRDTYGAYRRINRRFAEALLLLLQHNDLVWVQDYHLFHVGQELRSLGWKGKMGFFLHVPFPAADIFAILPWGRQLLEGLMQYDLVGFQTERYVYNAIDSLLTEIGGTFEEGVFVNGNTSVRIDSYPIGIDPGPYRNAEREPTAFEQPVTRSPNPQRLILGVDRLDYTKGIPQRLRAFERLLERNPSLRGNVGYMQISSPSRTRVPEYIQEKEQVDQLVGRINGRFSEAGWLPIRYLYRSYKPQELAAFYRDADVCLVTPLRDGMNLVAKEFVASQGDDPGALVLSRFCGAAESMTEALIVNPYDIDGTAMATYRALRMPRRERRQRWRALMDTVTAHTVQDWCASFCQDLAVSQPLQVSAPAHAVVG